ncbi:hypothetical protein PV08_00039 [Exophiala spinifera]|uniref:Uncharacterized protein n=1 Tax=Exophiala spinifera TaxID=91928 RepID=A0A0D2A3L1_9EURO|nr:uncharacterized protein PV08_00039 [Exophiala spinifera]KIW19467.1 hypothetical protein PV08_00039 [Exophiala spinifera]
MNNPALPPYGAAGRAFPPSPAQAAFQPGLVANHLQQLTHPQVAPQPISQPIYHQNPGHIGAFPPSNHSPSQQGRWASSLALHHADLVPGYPTNGPSPMSLTQAASQPPPYASTLPQMSTPTPPLQAASSASSDTHTAAVMGLPVHSNSSLAQQAQMQNAAQMAHNIPQQQQAQSEHQLDGGAVSMSPQSAARERARVSVLLDINTHLLQEVISLQEQEKTGNSAVSGQQSPDSPSSATDPTNALNSSADEPPKSAGGAKQPSQEYADCMRRLQANLSYLAAIADAKKKANGALPYGPTIMAPPAHLSKVHDLYKQLNSLFPDAGQSATNKGLATQQHHGQNATAELRQSDSVLADV